MRRPGPYARYRTYLLNGTALKIVHPGGRFFRQKHPKDRFVSQNETIV